MMTKLLEEAIAKVRELPAEDQDTFGSGHHRWIMAFFDKRLVA